MSIQPRDIQIITDTLVKSRVLCVKAPVRSGRSSYLPLAMLDQAQKDNADSNVIVVEHTSEAAKSNANFVSRNQTPGLVGYIKQGSNMTMDSPKLMYMTPETLSDIYLDLFHSQGDNIPSKPVASIIIINDAYAGNAYINLAEYLWFQGVLRGYPSPWMLLTTSVPGESSFVGFRYPEHVIPNPTPVEIMWTPGIDSDSDLASDMYDAIKSRHLNYPVPEGAREGWVVFAGTKSIALVLAKRLEKDSIGSIDGLDAALLPTRLPLVCGERRISIVTSMYEHTVPYNYVDGVFDSMILSVGYRSVPSNKGVSMRRAGYGKFCKRLISEEGYNNLPGNTPSITDMDALVSVAINLNEVNVDYINFMKINDVPEYTISRLGKTLDDLDLIVDGNVTQRGQYVSGLDLDPFTASMVYELSRSKVESNVMYPAIVSMVAISVAGTALFNATPQSFADHSDLSVIVSAMIDYIRSGQTSRDWADQHMAHIGHMRTIESRVKDTINILTNLQPDLVIGVGMTATTTAESRSVLDSDIVIDLIVDLSPKVYESMIMTQNGLMGDHMYISPNDRVYRWYPKHHPIHTKPTSSEKVIAFRIKEWTSSKGISRNITFGHPVNDVVTGYNDLEDLDDLLDF